MAAVLTCVPTQKAVVTHVLAKVFSLHPPPTPVQTSHFFVVTSCEVDLKVTQFSFPLTVQFTVGAVDTEFIQFTCTFLVQNMDEVFFSAVRTSLFPLLLEPVLEAGFTKVLTAASSEVGITKHLGTDVAHEFLSIFLVDWFAIITTILWLIRDVCNSHSGDSEGGNEHHSVQPWILL